MDKLKPILAQKFWILFGCALLIPIIGWWMDTGNLAATIETRQKEINTAFDSTNVGGDVPNDDWKKKLADINSLQTQQLRASTLRLWETQRALKTWPSDIAPMMTNVEYRGAIPNRACDIYRNSYFAEIRRLYQIVHPYDPMTGNGLAVIDPQAIQHIKPERWQFLPPSPEEMWNAQEEIWLWESLLRAIDSVNAGATSISDSAIRSIQHVDQMGGTLKPQESGGGGGAGAGMPGGGAAAAAPPPAIGADSAAASPFGGAGLGAGGAGTGSSAKTAAFSPSDEFGSAQSQGSSGSGDSGTAGAGAGALPASALGGATPAAGGGESKQAIRYIDEDPNLPYKLRGFYIQVTMDHRKVPDLLAALTNMPYPTQIIRVQQVAKYDEERGGGSGAAVPGPIGVGAGIGIGGNPMGLGAGDAALPFNVGDAGAGAAGGEGVASGDQLRRLFQTAMDDPYLADVAIAGVMTLFQPPKDIGTPDPNQPQPAAAAGTVPPQTGNPGEPVPGATPPDSAPLPGNEGTPPAANPSQPVGPGTPAPTDRPVGPSDPAATPPGGTPPTAAPATATPPAAPGASPATPAGTEPPKPAPGVPATPGNDKPATP